MKYFLLLLSLLVFTSCDGKGQAVQRDCASLKRGMNKSAVKAIFNNCRISFETNEVLRLDHVTKSFETNHISYSRVSFASKFPLGWDMCTVYFDESERIIAYNYVTDN